MIIVIVLLVNSCANLQIGPVHRVLGCGHQAALAFSLVSKEYDKLLIKRSIILLQSPEHSLLIENLQVLIILKLLPHNICLNVLMQ